MDFNISASTLINEKDSDSSKCTKKFWYDETAATPTCRVNHGVQPTGDVTSAQKALLISMAFIVHLLVVANIRIIRIDVLCTVGESVGNVSSSWKPFSLPAPSLHPPVGGASRRP